jgi:hypothetical protein
MTLKYMSRIRLVGGTITKTTGGDHNMYSEGNIVFNSGTTITETNDVGITHGEPKAPPVKIMNEAVKEIELLTSLEFGSTNDKADKIDNPGIIFSKT